MLSRNSNKLRRIGWLTCLVMILVLAYGGLKSGREAIYQAMGVRGLQVAAAEMTADELKNPFICLRNAGNINQAQAALHKISDTYLRGIGLCTAGERDEGLSQFKKAGWHSNAEIQYVAGLSAIDAHRGVEAIAGLELDNNDLLATMQELIIQPDVDPYPFLRYLAQHANAEPETWGLWLEGSTRLEAANQWKDALGLINEGLAIAPPNVYGSLYLREGQIYETKSEPRDYHSALAYFNQALESGGWINPYDEFSTHIERGAVYRVLKDEYSLDLALEEFRSALKLQPKDYWAFYELGITYLYDLKDLDQAEVFLRQAMATNEQYPYAYYYLGEIYKGRGDNGVALNWYRQALERQPNWQEALDRIKELEGK